MKRGFALALPESIMEEAYAAPGAGIGHSDEADQAAISTLIDRGEGSTQHHPDSPQSPSTVQANRLQTLAGDDRVKELTIALLREHAAHYGKDHPQLRSSVEESFPRHEGSITKKSIVTDSLGIDLKTNKKLSVLEEIVMHLLVQKDPSLPKTEPSLNFEWNEDGTSVDINGLKISQETHSDRFIVQDIHELDMANAIILGKGAGGRVMKVRHTPSGEWYAVKEISVGSDEVITQVKSEMRVLYSMTTDDDVESLFLVRCHGVFYDQGMLYLVMNLMSGALKDALDVHGPFPEQHLCAMYYQALRGLEVLHYTRKQLHRDVKPHNILYNDLGDVQISDFGISSERVQTMNANARATFCGTLAYMSPARVEGLKYSFESDIWGIGVSLYQMATGQLLPGSTTPFGIMGFRTEPPTLPPTAPNGVAFSPEFIDFVSRCLNPRVSAVSEEEGTTVKELLAHPWMKRMHLQRSRELVAEAAQVVEQMRRQQQQEQEQQSLQQQQQPQRPNAVNKLDQFLGAI